MPLESLKTPCTGFCEVAKGWGICYGCGRRIDEIMDWSRMTDQDREKVMVESRDRLNKLYGDDGK